MIPGELPLVQELTCTLREWAVIWRNLYVVSVPQGWDPAMASFLGPQSVCLFYSVQAALGGGRPVSPGPHSGWPPADSHFPGIGSLIWAQPREVGVIIHEFSLFSADKHADCESNNDSNNCRRLPNPLLSARNYCDPYDTPVKEAQLQLLTHW